MTSLSFADLETITGGAAAAPTYDQFKNDLTSSLRSDYKGFICKAAGLQGGNTFATQVYGKNASSADRIRASKMITSYCNGGAQLPAAAPPFPKF